MNHQQPHFQGAERSKYKGHLDPTNVFFVYAIKLYITKD